ncbi:MAG: hypothetical protein SVN78_10235, partial [Deferribacterota bacterium]|nr:hypothetical protein [Deferribacterota bacterium]
KIFIISSIILFIFSNPIFFIEGIYNLLHFTTNYIIGKPDSSGINMPNILSTITEAQKRPINMTMSAILSNNYINFIGLLSFIIISLFFYKKIIPIIPLFLLGIISFKSSIRFVMFLAPFVGIGYGLLIHFIVEKFKISEKYNEFYVYIGSLLFAILLTVVLIAKTSFYNYTPIPSIQQDIVKSFIDIKNKGFKDAKIVTWWDYGYAIEDITSYATFHDGGSQNTLKTYLIAKSLTNNDQRTLYNIINLLSGYKIETINKLFNSNLSFKEIFKNINNNNNKDDIYLLFTSDMITKYNAISQIGSFNIKTGSSQPGGYQLLNCSSFTNKQLECGKFSIDLTSGLINNKIPLKNVSFVSNGEIKDSFDYFDNGLFAEILIKNRSIIGVFLLEENTYRSNFNQIYILGNYNSTHLTEVYNNFPSARMFKIVNNK